jgi:vitamin B12 transporter
MKITPLAKAVSFGLSLCVFAATADEKTSTDENIEKITVVANRVATPLEQIAASVSILDEKDIEALGFVSLADILRTQPGIGVSNSGGAGKNTTLRIRGEEGFRTQLYIDGVELSDPTAPQVTPIFDDILTSQITRVEILRGTQGLSYGADAGGVINVTTNSTNEAFTANAKAEYGSFSSRLFKFDVGASNDVGSVFVAVSDFTTNGFNASSNDTSGEEDGYDNTTVHIKGEVRLSSNLDAQIVIRDVTGDTEFDACFDNTTFALINDCTSDNENTTARLSLKYTTNQSSHSLGVANTDVERQFFSNGEAGFLAEGSVQRLDYVGTTQLKQHQLVYGVDIENEENDVDGIQRFQRGAFFDYQVQATQELHLTAGLRYDDNETFGSFTSVRLGGVYLYQLSSSQQLKYKATYGTGFRAPSLFEQAFNNGPFAFGEAAGLELSEEQSEGFDIGVEYSDDSGLSAGITYFDQRIEDEIIFDGAQFQGFLQASGETESKGFELDVEQGYNSGLYLRANYTYNDTETSDGQDRIRRPKHIANAVVIYPLTDKLQVSGNARLSKDAVDIGDVELSDYVIFGLNVSYQITDNLGLSLRAENLFDREYTEVLGFNTSGSAFYLGISATL